MIAIKGYDLLGQLQDEGIRFAWSDARYKHYVESAAFNKRTKLSQEEVCAYTTSVSAGCVLRSLGYPCVFCRTGRTLPFGGLLTYREIAKQNIFMTLADIHCDDHPELAARPREFAYMGQGEPGYSYSQVRMAIELTNKVMKRLGQTVYRHIIATSGVIESIAAFKNDVAHYFTERVTLHLSVHAAERRSELMPLNDIYSISEILKQANDVYSLTGEKTCVGVMLFWNYIATPNARPYSNTAETIIPLLERLDPDKYRLSFCEYNPSRETGHADIYPEEEAQRLLTVARERHFEAKLFSSFGRKELTACGMLGGKEPKRVASQKWQRLDAMAEELINETI